MSSIRDGMRQQYKEAGAAMDRPTVWPSCCYGGAEHSDARSRRAGGRDRTHSTPALAVLRVVVTAAFLHIAA
jgi:hypothetical protein